MDTLNIDKIQKSDIDIISQKLLHAFALVLPTDTIYGFSCLATSDRAVEKLYKIKQRPITKKFIVLVKSYCMLRDYFFVSKKQDEYIRSIWSNDRNDEACLVSTTPTTFILKPRDKFASQLRRGTQEGIAVRLPRHELLIKILKKVNKPIVSTSLNISEQANIANLSEIEKTFKTLPDLVVDMGKSRKTKASRIVDIRDMEEVRVIRN